MNQNQNKTIETIKETFERTDFPNLVWTSNHYNNFYAWLKLKEIPPTCQKRQNFCKASMPVYARSLPTPKTVRLKRTAVR